MASSSRRHGVGRPAVLPVLLAVLGTLVPAWADKPGIRWVKNAGAPGAYHVEVSPLPNFTLPVDPAERTRLLTVRVHSPDRSPLPAMAGSYSFRDGVLTFQPSFPLQPGLRYRATFDSNTADLQVPARSKAPAGSVTKISPTADELPLNVLKFYLHFSTPMSRGSVYQHVRLLDVNGKQVEDPFLELPEELWNPEMTRLTLLLDPGRIKRGLLPNEQVGEVLKANQEYTLVVSEAWKTARGARLEKPFRKTFRAISADYRQPDPKKWQWSYPRATSREPLRVEFSEPLDAALASRLLTVWLAGNPVFGKTTLRTAEKVWEFVPDRAWSRREYEVRIDHRVEDLAGNSIDRPFEEALDRHPDAAGRPPGRTRHTFLPARTTRAE